MAKQMQWYKVRVFGTAYYEDIVRASSPEEAEECHNEGYTLTPTELVNVDGIEVTEATPEEIRLVRTT